MAVTDQAARVAPYVEQLLDDENVRENLRGAVQATRQAFGRARRKKRASQALKDRKVQRRVQEAMHAAGEVVSAITREPRRRKRTRRVRALAGLAIGGGGLALALNPDARRKALAFLGGEDGGAPDTTAPVEAAGGATG